MRKFFLSCSMLVAMISLSVGTAHATESLVDNCSGFPMEYTIVSGDTLSQIALAAYEFIPGVTLTTGMQHIKGENHIQDINMIYTGDVITLSCPAKNARYFQKPSVSGIEVTTVAEIRPLEISLAVSNPLPNFPIMIPTPVAPQMVRADVVNMNPVEVSEVAKPLPTKTIPTALVKRSKPVREKEIYVFYVQISREDVGEVPNGKYPALLLSGLNNKEWKNHDRITVETTSSSKKIEIKVSLKSAPSKDALLAVMLGKKQIPIYLNLPTHGSMIAGSMPKQLDPKLYASLESEYPGKHAHIGSVILSNLQVIGPAAVIFAVTGSPFGLIPAGISLGSRFFLSRARRKSAERQEQQEETAQESEINLLKAQNADLNGRLQSLEDLSKPTTGDVKVAQLDH
jgi:hypothetical protein